MTDKTEAECVAEYHAAHNNYGDHMRAGILKYRDIGDEDVRSAMILEDMPPAVIDRMRSAVLTLEQCRAELRKRDVEAHERIAKGYDFSWAREETT